MLLFDTSYVEIRSVLSEISLEISLDYPCIQGRVPWHPTVSVALAFTALGCVPLFNVKA